MNRSKPCPPATASFALATCCLVALFAGRSVAAELRLRSQCEATGTLVRLSDIADIVGATPQQTETLSAIELFPTPVHGERRFLTVREIQDLLLLRGVNLTEHQLSGSSQVAVQAKSDAKPRELPAASTVTTQRVNRRVSDAIVKYLDSRVTDHQAWTVESRLTEDQVRLLAGSARSIAISGGQAPWTGTQHFEVSVDLQQGPVHFALDAQVSLPAEVAVAVRALPRGAVIRQGDVEMQRLSNADVDSSAIRSVEEAIGRETTRMIAAGKSVSSDSLRAPLQVRRGEVVTVYVNNAGIRIRTAARARDDGSEGELVSVESLLDRSTYYARVNGIRQVEVYGRAAHVESADSRGSAGIVRR